MADALPMAYPEEWVLLGVVRMFRRPFERELHPVVRLQASYPERAHRKQPFHEVGSIGCTDGFVGPFIRPVGGVIDEIVNIGLPAVLEKVELVFDVHLGVLSGNEDDDFFGVPFFLSLDPLGGGAGIFVPQAAVLQKTVNPVSVQKDGMPLEQMRLNDLAPPTILFPHFGDQFDGHSG